MMEFSSSYRTAIFSRCSTNYGGEDTRETHEDPSLKNSSNESELFKQQLNQQSSLTDCQLKHSIFNMQWNRTWPHLWAMDKTVSILQKYLYIFRIVKYTPFHPFIHECEYEFKWLHPRGSGICIEATDNLTEV